VFISLATTHLLVVPAKLRVALSSLVRIAGYVAIAGVVAAWYVAFAHVTNAAFGRDLIPMGGWPQHSRGTPAYHEGAE
jgi:succinate-acetate transporter protein